MKNYLLLIIDSLNYSHVKSSELELMPYLEKLKKDGISCSDMYSQAPYTEAAVMSLYCGQDVLDNGGYLKRFKNAPRTVFEAMKEYGYKTYFNSYQPQCYPSSLRRGVDDIFYSVGYDLAALWPYRLSHYSEFFKCGELTHKDYEDLYDILEDNFKEWLIFVDNLILNDPSCSMIRGNAAEYDPRAVKTEVLREKAIYEQDKKQYLEELFTLGRRHRLFSIPAYDQKTKIKDRKFTDQAREIFVPLVKKISKKNFRSNLKNNKRKTVGLGKQFGKCITSPSKRSLKDFLKCVYGVLNVLFDFDLKQRIAPDYDYFKNAPSARTHFDHYLNWCEQNTHPYFACIHIDDIHNPEVFFTYDSTDADLLLSERKIAEELLSGMGKKYFGSVTHDLSLRYIDNCIEYLVETMKARGMMENTCLVITADHGFSFSNNPIRDTYVTNLYLENYNVPFVIVNSDKEPCEINALCSTKDVPITLCDLAFGASDCSFSGKSIFSNHKYDNVTIEYCGGGCPDLSRREIKIAAFDKEWFVGALCTADGTFGDDKLTEIYDLKNDPNQFENLVGKCELEKIRHLISVIGERLATISGAD